MANLNFDISIMRRIHNILSTIGAVCRVGVQKVSVASVGFILYVMLKKPSIHNIGIYIWLKSHLALSVQLQVFIIQYFVEGRN